MMHSRPNELLTCLLLFVLAAPATAVPNDVGEKNPVADPKAVVIEGSVRFTVLTSQLIRLEWSESGQFEDRASLVFIHRRLPVPAFRVARENHWLILKTEKLTVRFLSGSGAFGKDNLRIEFDLNGKAVTWTPGTEDKGNLGGTIRTLDGVQGETALGTGLVSRDGWTLVDDTERPLFDASDWPWVMARPPGKHQDWYFFGYGHDYKRALFDYTRVAGKIPMPPRFAFGTWWSRYWSYTDEEFENLVRGFQQHDIPLDVLVIDMDWHPTFGVKWWENKKDQAGQRLGWTGYTWNRTLFPEPPRFLQWAHDQGLKTTLNMHPASGVQPHEVRYPEMARAMGMDPAAQKYVPFDIADKRFARNYLEILHHPLERQGIDFFWLDWQQQQITSVPGLNPTWWLNYVHFTDMERRGMRPLLLHRWGGLGNHRYQIGFSGDTISVWESLAFQPYFTATAANVGYSYWSHDIGGHMPGNVSPELFTRWIQYGVFSPILRTHTTKNPEAERRIWAYPAEYAEAMREALLLRYALLPYVYTSAREAYDTGISICRPVYYDNPELPEAYEFRAQYMFGDSMLVAPVSTPADKATLLAAKKVWLPAGPWIEWPSGKTLKGPARIERSFAEDEIPVYIRAGAVIPMQPKMRYVGEKPLDPLILTIFPGEQGEGRIYEDAGNTLGYQNDEFAWTTVRHSREPGGMRRIEIYPVEGRYPGMPAERAYELRLFMTLPPESVRVRDTTVPYSAEARPGSWHYDGNTLTTVVVLPKWSLRERVEVVLKIADDPDAQRLVDGARGRIARLKRAMALLNTTWPRGWSPDVLVEAAQAGRRMTLDPTRARSELEKLLANERHVIDEIYRSEASCETTLRALAQLGETAKCLAGPAPTPAP